MPHFLSRLRYFPTISNKSRQRTVQFRDPFCQKKFKLTQSWKKLIKSNHPIRAPIDTRGRFHSRMSEIAWTIASKSGVTIWDLILGKSCKTQFTCINCEIMNGLIQSKSREYCILSNFWEILGDREKWCPQTKFNINKRF